MPDAKRYKEVNLDADDQGTHSGFLSSSLGEENWDTNVGSVRQPDTTTVSSSDAWAKAIENLIIHAANRAEREDRELSIEDVLANFSKDAQRKIIARLPAGQQSFDVVSAAIQLGMAERNIEFPRGRGRKREGKEVKETYTIRLEPRHLEALKIFGLDPRTVVKSLAELMDRYLAKDDAAKALVPVLGALLSESGRKQPIAARLEPANVEKWRRAVAESVLRAVEKSRRH
jgi:hypothetical protein